MNLFDTFQTNLVDEPKTFPLSDEAEITMRPIGGDTARRAFEQMMEPYSVRLNAGGSLTEKENKNLTIRFYAEHVVTGWKGIKDADNVEIEFSPARAKELFSDPKIEGFFTLIVRMSQNEAAFKAKAAESDAGN